MKRLVLAALSALTIAAPMATVSAPTAAFADGPRWDDRRDHRDGRGDRGDRRHDGRRDSRHDNGGYWDRRDGGYHGSDRWERGNRTWWRGRPEWRGYEGRRNGQWYAPGYGYYSVERQWYGHSWRRGEYLPGAYRRYYVRDYDFYGLRAPPRGYSWVYVGGDIVLVSLASGLILDVLLDVY